MMRFTRLVLLFLAFGLSACAETTLVVDQTKMITQQPTQTYGYKVGQPYQVDGVWYYPAVNYDYDETGIASWYGPGFVGQATASGEIYDQYAMTAAHKTLPLPTLVRVTNLENGRQIQLRINDRGPFVNNRIIDVSYRAAQLLGMDVNGTARVRVQVMADESRQLAAQLGGGEAGLGSAKVAAAPAPKVVTQPLAGGTQVASMAPAAPKSMVGQATGPLPQPSTKVVLEPVHPTNLFVQAGAFLQITNANNLRSKLAGIASARIIPVQLGAQRFYRVRLGPIATVADADRVLGQVIAMGNRDARLIVE
ncbi:MAG TPA: septal ring lytic transglycosylase RlpA family protein [Candidatus Udaeobacter sp.]|nr:septal ring lytic transglycosylase RlpA family protein [Candidatus Udaeobacter sp.]